MKKNIIYIHTHDSGRVLSPYGYDVPTPHLQDFAEDATLFKQAYSAGPTCSPSRAALLTGMYPHSNGMFGLSQRGFTLNDYNQHLANYLKKQGYHTALCGIQHESSSYLDPDTGAKTIGYDENLSTDNTGMSEEELVQWDYNNASQVSAWLKDRDQEQPFFLSLGFFATHRRFPLEGRQQNADADHVNPPYPVPDRPESRADYAGYLNSATWFDEAFHIVIETLKETGLYEQSIIIFTTDHGIAFPFSKCTLYDSGIGVSLIVRVPESQMQGKVVDDLVSQVDIFPTLCDLQDMAQPDYLQGTSFAHVFDKEETEARDDIFAEINFHTSYEPARAVRTKRYKYVRYFDDDYLWINQSNIDNSPTKSYYIEHALGDVKKDKEALYDLLYDAGERHNIAGEAAYEDVLTDMRARLATYQEQTDDPILNGHIDVQPEWKVNKRSCVNPSSKDPDDYISLPE